jgi:hypothetical protein
MATPDQPRYANPRILLSGDGPISSSHRCTNRRRFGCRLGVGVSDSRGRAANSHRGTRRRLRRDGTASNNLYCPPCPKLQRPLHRDRRRNGYYAGVVAWVVQAPPRGPGGPPSENARMGAAMPLGPLGTAAEGCADLRPHTDVGAPAPTVLVSPVLVTGLKVRLLGV